MLEVDRAFFGDYAPNLFLVGAPKCGTTALAEWLGRHPEVHMSPYKEPYYFADFDVSFSVRDPVEYRRLLTPPHRKTYRGEASPGYLYSRGVATRLHSLFPDAKILISLRNPLELAISLHRQMLTTGDETLSSFNAAYARSLAGRHYPRCSIPMMLDYPARARLSDGLQRYRSLFGTENTHVVFQEDLVVRPTEALGNILEFLGLPSDSAPELRRINVREQRLPYVPARRFLKQNPALRALTTTLVPRRWIERLKILSAVIQPQPEVAAQVSDPELLLEVRRLESLTGRNLDHWAQRVLNARK